MQYRKILKDFEPYEWEISNKDIALKFNLNEQDIIRFDTNTSPFIPKEWLNNIASKLETLGINDYPDTSYIKLRKSISKYININENQISVTNGADEGLDIISKIFIDKDTDIIISTPTYSFYSIVTKIMGGNIISIPRKKNFVDDIENILKSPKRKNNIIFLCNPNNPTGNSIERKNVIRLLNEINSVIVIDEAYVEFSGNTLVDLTKKYNNLIILRTFSKAFSLAGARIGYIIASKTMVDILNKVRPPNSLSVISLALADIAINDIEKVNDNIKLIINERTKCKNFLENIPGINVFPSDANFLLIKFNKINSDIIYNLLLKEGLIVRNLNNIQSLENCLRFSIRNSKQNNVLLNTISKIINNN